MALVDTGSGTLTGKLVYYGVPGAGKSTNLESLFLGIPASRRGQARTIGPPGDRIVTFDCLPNNPALIPGWTTRLRVCAAPGRPSERVLRELVEHADAVAFVADSQLERLMENSDAREELSRLLGASGADPRTLPMVFQWNKRDLPSAYPSLELVRLLNPFNAPSFEAIATRGHGVFETFGQLAHLAAAQLFRRYTNARQQVATHRDEGVHTEQLSPDDLRRLHRDPAASLDLSTPDTRGVDPAASQGVTQSVDPLALISLDEPEDEQRAMPTELGGYRVLSELGRGGMGVVYLGQKPDTDQKVALKVVHIDPKAQTRMPLVRERFRREGEITAKLEHPGIVRVLGSGEHPGGPYLVYELVEGCRGLTDAFVGLDLLGRVALVRQAARAIGYAHRHGVVHRDIKPDNLLVNASGVVKVADFGLALAMGMERLTKTGAFVGTPTHMAPEQFEGKDHDVGPETDVWALGVTLYEALTGALPFPSKRIVELISEILSGEPKSPALVDPRVTPGVEAICFKALSKRPADRYPDATALARELDQVLRLLSGEARPRPLADGVQQAERIGERVAALVSADPPTARARGQEDAWALLGGGLPRDPDLAAEVRQKALVARNLLANYVLLESLDPGNSASLHRAWDTEGRKQVLLRKIASVSALNAKAKLALGSARTLRKPHLVPVLGFGTDEDRFFLASELIAGETLAARRRSTKRTALVIRDAARGLANALQHGLPHGGLHPGCLLIDPQGVGWVLDLGFAAALAQVQRPGAEASALSGYCAPESRAGAGPPTEESEVYSLGATLYFGLTGSAPRLDDLRPPSALSRGRVPQQLDSICLKSLHADPDQRYRSPGEFAGALQSFLDQHERKA